MEVISKMMMYEKMGNSLRFMLDFVKLLMGMRCRRKDQSRMDVSLFYFTQSPSKKRHKNQGFPGIGVHPVLRKYEGNRPDENFQF